MKRHDRIFSGGIIIVLFVILTIPSKSQNPIDDAIEQLSSDNVQGYIQPLLDGFGANLNSGFPGSARIRKAGLTFRLQVVGMGTLIGDAEKTYLATPPEPYPQEPIETATVFGGEGAIVSIPAGARYRFQNGQIDTRIIPFAVPQLTIGDFLGTQATIRYLPIPAFEEYPEINLFGIGVRHSISQYFPFFPVDVAVGGFYQTLSVGEYLDTKATAFAAQVSKTFFLLTLYGGLQYETTDVNLSYTYTGPLPTGSASDRNVSINFKTENKFRTTAGVALSLRVIFLHADISVGNVTVISAGIGLGI